MNKDYDFHLMSDDNYEKLIVDLVYKNDLVAILNYETGIENCEIEISDKFDERIIWKFEFFEFKKSLNNILKIKSDLKMVELGENFTIKNSKLSTYKKDIIDLFYKNENVARFNTEHGADKLEIEIFDKDSQDVIWNLEVKSFLNALDDAFQKLKG